MTKKTYVVHGTDLLIDGKHVPDGGTVELDVDGFPHLARWLTPVAVKEKEPKAVAAQAADTPPADTPAADAAKNDKGDKA